MLSLQHDTGRWCTEYTYSAEDSMVGVRVLHNFGKLADESERSGSATLVSRAGGMKRIDEEDAMEGGLKGRISAGAEVYFSAKEKSAGGCVAVFVRRRSCRAAETLIHYFSFFDSVDGHPLYHAPGRDAAFVPAPDRVLDLCAPFGLFHLPPCIPARDNHHRTLQPHDGAYLRGLHCKGVERPFVELAVRL